jgi:site-specific recombinase XerD
MNDAVQELPSLLARYERRLRRDGLAERSIEKYCSDVAHFLAWLGARDPAEVRRQDVEEYLDEWFAAARPMQGTIRARVTALKSFYRYMESTGCMTTADGRDLRSPVERIKVRGGERKANDWLRDEEDRALLGCPMNEQERALVMLLRWTGCRIQEARGLEIQDVDFDRREISIRKSKTGTGIRRVPLLECLELELRAWFDYLRVRGLYRPDAPVLTTAHGTPMAEQFADRVIRRVAHRAGVRMVACMCETQKAHKHAAGCPRTRNGDKLSTVTAHTFRRTYGSYLLNRGVRVEVVSRLLGHADVRTTMQSYAELLPETIRAELRQAVA